MTQRRHGASRREEVQGVPSDVEQPPKPLLLLQAGEDRVPLAVTLLESFLREVAGGEVCRPPNEGAYRLAVPPGSVAPGDDLQGRGADCHPAVRVGRVDRLRVPPHHDTPPSRHEFSSTSRPYAKSPNLRATLAPASARRRSCSVSTGLAGPVHSWRHPWMWRRSATAARSSAGNSPSGCGGQWPQNSRTSSCRSRPNSRMAVLALASEKSRRNTSRKAG